MTDPADALSRTRRLRELLAERRPGPLMFAPAPPEALAEAGAIGPELATLAVNTLLDAHQEARAPETGERAADLAERLRLVGTLPALIGCIERLPEWDSVAEAALRAVASMGADATAPLLAAFTRCGTREQRARIALALMRAGSKDDRVRSAYLAMLADDPVNGAQLLAEHGDRGALPHLSATLDRLEPSAAGAEDPRADEEVVAVAQAIRSLRGGFTEGQREKVERAWTRSEDRAHGPSTRGRG